MSDPYHINGLFVGQLDQEQLEWFDWQVSLGRASRSYEGGAGFMGLATVRLRDVVFVTEMEGE